MAAANSPHPRRRQPPPEAAGPQIVRVDAENAYRLYLAARLPEGVTVPPLPTLGSTLRLPGMPPHAPEARWVIHSIDPEVLAVQRERERHRPRYDALFEALQMACRQTPDAHVRIALSVAYVCAMDACNLYYTGEPRRVTQVFLGSSHGLCFLDYLPDGSARIDAVPLSERRAQWLRNREQQQRRHDPARG